jgi:Ni/Fe-hydrogenase subunit HybB-like protein
MKLSKNLKKIVTMPNMLFILASIMALTIICKKDINEGLNDTENAGRGKAPLGVVIVFFILMFSFVFIRPR